MARRRTAYALMKLLRGPPVRPKQVHKDRRLIGKRRACRRKVEDDDQ